MGFFAGIDLGTSSTKVLIMDEAGNVLGVGNASYDVKIPMTSYAEQDPEEWWTAVKAALAGAAAAAGIPATRIDAVSFSGQMHGVVALDYEKRPVCPAIIHLDQRSGPLLGEIRETAGSLMKEELLNQPCAGMMIITLYWMKKENPGLFEKIRFVLSPKDYIRFRLTGEIGTEVTDAAASLGFSVKNRRWCTELFHRLGIPEEIFPPVHESCEVAGTVTSKACEETGLAPEAKVVFGAGDSLAAMTGIGVIGPGTMACNIGTASQLVVVADHPVFDPQFRVQTWCHTRPGCWAIQSGALNGGSTLSWLKKRILNSTAPFSVLDQEAGEVPPGSEGLIFLPYLSGERTPWNNPSAKGVYFGLGMNHTQAHLIRATMEGVIFNLRECLGIFDEIHLERNSLLASGGAARGKTWKQIQADMLDMPVRTAKVEEEACQGAAILAMVGAGVFPDIPAACSQIIRLSSEVVEPIPENVRRYRERQALFHSLYGQVEGLFKL